MEEAIHISGHHHPVSSWRTSSRSININISVFRQQCAHACHVVLRKIALAWPALLATLGVWVSRYQFCSMFWANHNILFDNDFILFYFSLPDFWLQLVLVVGRSYLSNKTAFFSTSAPLNSKPKTIFDVFLLKRMWECVFFFASQLKTEKSFSSRILGWIKLQAFVLHSGWNGKKIH